MLILAFDYGTRRTGVALGSHLSGARPLAVLPSKPEEALYASIAKLVREWAPTQMVVGLPLTLDGGTQYMTERASEFAEGLRSRFGLPLVMHDERSTSKMADRCFAELRAAGLKKRKDAQLLDAMAASLILEDYLVGADYSTTAPVG
jgi:putative Holliday junction resolvase